MRRAVSEKYLEFKSKIGRAYVRRDKANLLRNVDAAVFDCDGVLIDTKDSYDKTISRTVAYILEGFTAYPFPRDLINDEIVFLFKSSGGFNSDWDVCYSILMFILCNLPEEYQEIFKRTIKTTSSAKGPLERFLSVKNNVRKGIVHGKISESDVERLIDDLKLFVKKLDESGVGSVDRNLLSTLGTSLKYLYKGLKFLLYYPPEFGKSIIPTVYEEIFCGPNLTKKIYGKEPVFHKELGLIENERIIIKPETFDHLAAIFGKANFGIASGSRFVPAKHVLGDILSRFNPEAMIFLDDIEREERILKSIGKIPDEVKQSVLMKPNPFSLLKAAKGLKPSRLCLYIGDSMEDALMVKKAKRSGKNFIFVGVYAYSSFKDAALQSFFKAGADVILPSVNELPYILRKVRGL